MLAPLLVLALSAVARPQAPENPLAAVRLATTAVEGDSVEAVRARWAAAGSPPGSDRTARLGLGMLSYLAYDLDAAAATLTALLPTAGEPADLVSVRARIGLAQVARSRADFRSAERLLTEARQEAERLPDALAATEALLVLAMTRSRTLGPGAAEALFAEARARIGDDPYLGALYHCAHADLLVLTNRPAREDAERGAELAARAGAGRLRAACVAARASDRAREGDVDGALADMRESAELRRALRDYIGLAVSLQWRGYWLRSVGRLEQARLELQDAVAAARIAGAASPLAWSFTNLAYIDLSLRDARSGLAHADSAALLLGVQGDRYGEGTIEGVLGDLAFVAGDLDGARSAYARSVDILEPLDFDMGLVSARLGLAHVAMAAGAWDEADRELHLAEGTASDLRAGAEGDGLAYHGGLLALRRGRLDEAAALLSGGLRRVSLGGAAQPERAYHYAMRLAEVEAARGDLEAALRHAEEAMDALEAWRSTLSLPELRLLAFQVSEDRSDPDLGFATIVAALVRGGRVDEAFGLAERLRDRTLRDRVTRLEALRPGAEGPLATAARPDAADGTMAAGEVREALPDRETGLLAWVTGRGGEPTTLFAVDAAGVRARVLPPADSVDAAVRRLVASVEAGLLPPALVRSVSDAVLGEAPALLDPAVRRLVLIPDGPVHLVPFDVLSVADGASFLDRFSFSVQSSAGLAARTWGSAPKPTSGSVLAVGDPLLAEGGDSGFAPLPGALREARRAASYGTGSTLVTGSAATESWVKGLAAGRYGMIHLATHARLDEGTLAGSVLLLAPGDEDDGVLRAGEIAQLRLDAGIALLSACSTAEGHVVRGEGMIGLASALREAGVDAVVLTRWQVSDEDQEDLIERLYAGLAEGLTVAEAVRAAKLELRARGALPSVWAALTVAGDGNVVLPLRPPRRVAWPYALGAASAVAFALMLLAGRKARQPR